MGEDVAKIDIVADEKTEGDQEKGDNWDAKLSKPWDTPWKERLLNCCASFTACLNDHFSETRVRSTIPSGRISQQRICCHILGLCFPCMGWVI